MFYRRKIILSLIQLFQGEIEKTKLQKILFLYSKRKKEPEYDFVPYKYGCYSYSMKADLNKMVEKKYLLESRNGYAIIEAKNYLKLIKPEDKRLLKEMVNTYGSMSIDALVKHTYLNFPFYAIKSTIAKEKLSKNLYKRVEEQKPKNTTSALYTIGYEGSSLENYLNKLVKNDIKLLIDVRKNPLSRKYGFSKKSLKKYCNSLDIEYLHMPEVGIISDKRQKLETQKDYDKLFQDYQNTTLQETADNQKNIIKLLNDYSRIALTCFEANICQCHRLPLAESLKTYKKDLIIEHI